MPSLLANVPEGIVWGRVTAYVTSFVADGGTALPDGTPDAIPLNGTITLTPTVGVMVFPTLTPPQQAVIQSLVCPVIGGVLYAPGTTTENVGDRDPGVILVASEQPLGLPDRVQYRVTWALEGAQVTPVTIDVPSQGTVDLATVIPATPGPGKVIVVSTVDRERAEAARDVAEAAADTAETAATVAVTAKTLAEGFAGDAETARDQAVTAAAALQDTGWRDVSAALHEDCTGTLLVRRIGARVTASFNITSQVTTNYMRIWQMPEGWRPVANWCIIGMVPYGITGTALAVGPNGWSWLMDARRSQPLDTFTALVGELSWLTNDAFPSPAAYPGTPA